ncbi:hypothetical protein C8R45DRAFT_946983 [Mycena sanguinolenta]|nr:hypothetical protein C8R45DRAFT_946983 [Mycena sanguinolenta]
MEADADGRRDEVGVAGGMDSVRVGAPRNVCGSMIWIHTHFLAASRATHPAPGHETQCRKQEMSSQAQSTGYENFRADTTSTSWRRVAWTSRRRPTPTPIATTRLLRWSSSANRRLKPKQKRGGEPASEQECYHSRGVRLAKDEREPVWSGSAMIDAASELRMLATDLAIAHVVGKKSASALAAESTAAFALRARRPTRSIVEN